MGMYTNNKELNGNYSVVYESSFVKDLMLRKAKDSDNMGNEDNDNKISQVKFSTPTMSNILLAIKPTYAKAIYSGIKKYEYRKRIPNKPIKQIIIYETSPVSKITGTVIVSYIIQGTAKDIWEKTKDYSGIEHDKYMKYFNNNPYHKAYAYALYYPANWSNPCTLKEFSDMLGLDKELKVPQSFIYIRN